VYAESEKSLACIEAEESKSDRALHEFIDAVETVLWIARQYAQVRMLWTPYLSCFGRVFTQ
jgi:hypothetical protein